MGSASPQKRGRGQPRKIDGTLSKRICKVLRDGGSRNDAAVCAGVDPKTVRSEAHRNPEFAAEMEKAEVLGKVKHIRNVKAAGDSGEWRASLAMLERKWWKDFGKRKPGEISPERLVNIIVQLTNRLRDSLPPKYRAVVDGIVNDVVTAIEASHK